MISEERLEGAFHEVLDEWLDRTEFEVDETVQGLGIRRHRIEQLPTGMWRTYPLDDPNDKTYWDVTILTRRAGA